MWTRALANALLPNCVLFIFSLHHILVSFICKKFTRCYAKIILKLSKTPSFHVNIKIDKIMEPLAFLQSNSILDAVFGHPLIILI